MNPSSHVSGQAHPRRPKRRKHASAEAWCRRHELAAAAARQVVYERKSVEGSMLWGESLGATLGYEDEDMSGGTARWADLLHPDEREVAILAIGEAERNRTPYDITYRIRHRDGRYLWVRDCGQPGDSGSLVGMLADVTGPRLAEQSLKLDEARSRALFGSARDAVLVIRDEQIVDCNPSAERMFNCRREELLGHTPVFFSPPVQPDGRASDAVAGERLRAAFAGTASTFEWRHRRLDGSEFDAEVNFNRVEFDGAEYLQASVRDISARKQAERSLAAHEALWHDVFNVAPFPIAIARLHDGVFLEANAAFEGLIGRRVLGSSISPTEYEGRSRHVRERLLREGRIANEEIRTPDATGQQRHILYSAVLTRLRGEECAVIMMVDITEKKRAEDALRASEERFRRFIEASPVPIVVSHKGFLEYANAEFIRLIGLESAEAARGRSVFEMMAPESRKRVADHFSAQRRGLAAPGRYEVVGLRTDGSRFPAEISVAVIEVPGGTVNLSYVFDITERKRSEKALRTSEERYRSLIDGMQDIVYTLSVDGVIEFIGPQVRRYGFTPEDLIGRKFADLVAETDRGALVKDFMQVQVAEGEKPNTLRVETTGGAQVWFEEVGRTVRDAHGKVTGVSGILRDITERKDAEVERQALQSQLIQAQKMEAIGQLAGGVAHDFNNILTAILMQLEFLREEPFMPEHTRSGLKELEVEARRAANLTRQLLLFSRRQVMQPHLLDLNSLLGNLLKMLRRLIGEHIQLEFTGSEGDMWLEADAGMIEQVVMNLVVNARDAMPRGGRVTIATHSASFDAAVSQRNPEASPGRYVVLAVSDVGCGMDESVLSHIFEPFFTTKEAGHGTGLGLATVYGIVKQHRGWIEVRSAVGCGSTFEIFLPASAQTEAVAAAEDTQQPARGGSETLLVVEDESSVRRTIVASLRRLGYSVIEATDGKAAGEVWQRVRGSVDLLISDMIMPGGVSGLEIAHQLLGEKPGLRVILISGYSLEMAKHGLPREESIRFLQKPFEASGLAKLVRESLDAARSTAKSD